MDRVIGVQEIATNRRIDQRSLPVIFLECGVDRDTSL